MSDPNPRQIRDWNHGARRTVRCASGIRRGCRIDGVKTKGIDRGLDDSLDGALQDYVVSFPAALTCRRRNNLQHETQQVHLYSRTWTAGASTLTSSRGTAGGSSEAVSHPPGDSAPWSRNVTAAEATWSRSARSSHRVADGIATGTLARAAAARALVETAARESLRAEAAALAG